MRSQLGRLTADDISAVHDALSDPCRRRLLCILDDFDARMTHTDLSREIVRARHAEAEERIDEVEVEKVYISLYHCHVPKLAPQDLVDYDPSERRVALNDSAPVNSVEFINQ